MERLISVFGLFFMMFVAWLLSNNRRKPPWRAIIGGLFLQFALAYFVLNTSVGKCFFTAAKDAIEGVVALSDVGAKFVFGDNFYEHFFAFKVLPTIIFVSSISALLFYWGILQKVVQAMAWIMYKIMGSSGSESLSAAANIFMGQTEAPLLIKPYIATMTRSEILCMMTGGMATVAGGVMAAYVGFGISAGHLLAASIMSAPAAILISKILFPEEESSVTRGTVNISLKLDDQNAIDAACRGAAEGLKLAANVAAMLIAFIALIALANKLLGGLTGLVGFTLTVEDILGYISMPFAFVMGIPWEDCFKIGRLLGERIVINEFLAYIHLEDLIKNHEITQRSADIVIYALCGFANFGSIAIQIGGIGSLEPTRKADFAKLGLYSMIGGLLASYMTACIAGILL